MRMSFYLFEHYTLPNRYQVYHVLYVCGDVNRRHHVVETIHTLFHSFEEDIQYL